MNINEQKDSIEKLENENFKLKTQLDDAKEANQKQKKYYESKLELLNQELSKFKEKNRKFNRQLVNLEIEHETQVNQNRIKEEIIQKLKHTTDRLNEKMTILHMETDEAKDIGQEELIRVKDKLKETEEELLVLKHKRDAMVKQSMFRSKKNRSMHNSVIFVKKKQNSDGYDKNLQSNNIIPKKIRKFNTGLNLEEELQTEPDESEKLRKSSWWNGSFNFMGRSNRQSVAHEHKREIRPKKNSLAQKSRRDLDEVDTTSKTDWFISVIGSLDKKLKDIKLSLRKNE